MRNVLLKSLTALLGLALSLPAQSGGAYAPAVTPPTITVNMPETSQHRELARSYVLAFEALEVSRKIRLEVQRGARSEVIEPVVGLKASGSLLLLQVGTGSPNGRRSVVVRADDVVLLRENP